MQTQKQISPAEREAFVASNGGGEIISLRQDASVRQFFRVKRKDSSAILMEARPPLEDTVAYVFVRDKLDKIGLTVPEIYAADHTHGLVLMEDFGDIRFQELVTAPNPDWNKLYSLAVDALIHKAKADPKVALDQSVAYSDEYWLFRIEQFLIHYMPQVLKRQVSDDARAEFLGLYKQALDAAHEFDNVLLHGDYGVQNIYYLPEREGVKALGLIDFQDMTDARGNMMGSPAFDLSFLLRDPRMDLPQGLEEAMKARFIKAMGIKDASAFDFEYSTIGASQATKCLGLFARLAYVNKRPEYAPFLDICWRNLNANLRHPKLAGIRKWFEANGIDVGQAG